MSAHSHPFVRYAATVALAIAVALVFSWAVDSFAARPNPNQGGRRCGGFAGIPCPAGLICIDDPRDDCDPKRGGADCIGICRGPGGGTSQ